MNQLKIASRHVVALLALTALAAMAACGTTTPHLDDNFGLAVDAARAQQTINPDASRNTAVVTGHDANAASAAINAYQESFEKTADQGTGTVINIGGTGAR